MIIRRVFTLASVLFIASCSGGSNAGSSHASPTTEPSPVTFASPSPQASESTASTSQGSPIASAPYTLKASLPLYAQCVNLAQDFVNEDPKPRLIKRLPAGTEIVAVEPAWTQIAVNSDGTVYRYDRDEQDVRVRALGLDGCISFQDTVTDAGDIRDTGLQKYLDATMMWARNNPQVTSGGSPTAETIDSLDSATHYDSVDAIDAAEGAI